MKVLNSKSQMLLLQLVFLFLSLRLTSQSKPRIKCSDNREEFYSEDEDRWLSCKTKCTERKSYNGCKDCCFLQRSSLHPTHNNFLTSKNGTDKFFSVQSTTSNAILEGSDVIVQANEASTSKNTRKQTFYYKILLTITITTASGITILILVILITKWLASLKKGRYYGVTDTNSLKGAPPEYALPNSPPPS